MCLCLSDHAIWPLVYASVGGLSDRRLLHDLCWLDSPAFQASSSQLCDLMLFLDIRDFCTGDKSQNPKDSGDGYKELALHMVIRVSISVKDAERRSCLPALPTGILERRAETLGQSI